MLRSPLRCDAAVTVLIAGTLCERNQMRIRPLDGQEARALEIGSDLYASRIRAQTNRSVSDGSLPSVEAECDTDRIRSRAVIS